MFYAIIDIGSNSMRLSVYKCEIDKIKLILSKKSTAGLIGYVEEGKLVEKGIKKACSVLNNFNEILESMGLEHTYAFATASLRNITNSNDVLKQILEDTGFSVNLLSGEAEARLGYYGAAQTTNAMETGLFLDIGGGSTELVSFEGGKILRALSLPLGSLNLSLKYVKGITTHKSNIILMKQELKRELKRTKLFDCGEQYDICVTGGTARAARKLYNDIYDLPSENNVIEADKFSNVLIKYNEERRDIVKRIKQLTPDRIHTVIPGIVVLHTIAALCQCKTIVVSDFGVREGYLIKNVLDNGDQRF